MLIIGGVAWFALSDQGKAIWRQLFPDDGSSFPAPIGGPGGDQPGSVITVPKNPEFRIVLGEYDAIIRRGGLVNVRWTVQHLGPAGTYVAGMDFAPANWLCRLGAHDTPVANVEAYLDVGDDAGWANYSTQASFVYNGPGFWGLDVRGYVRDLQGRVYTNGWYCGGAVVV
jgi:hypothetical protein